MGCIFSRVAPSFERKYILGDSIGSGHFAFVHLCYLKKNREKQFAVKVINKADLVSLDLLTAEVDILKEVGNHPNILTLIDTFENENEFLIITEYCSGGDLFSRIVDSGFCSEKNTIHFMKQLVEAIQHIHEHGVTHRDLKPENILLESDHKDAIIKVADFGLSKLRGSSNDKNTVMKTVCGTWAYCAPEVIRREPYNHLVDNWTLGILMFIMLSGYHPFDMYGDSTEVTLLAAINGVKYDFNDEVWDNVSDPAKEIIRGLLQWKPEDRLTCQQLLKTDWLNGKIVVSKEINTQALANLERLNNLRKKILVTVTTTLAATKFKKKLRLLKEKKNNANKLKTQENNNEELKNNNNETQNNTNKNENTSVDTDAENSETIDGLEKKQANPKKIVEKNSAEEPEFSVEFDAVSKIENNENNPQNENNLKNEKNNDELMTNTTVMENKIMIKSNSSKVAWDGEDESLVDDFQATAIVPS